MWLDGEPGTSLPPTLRAAHYGDGVFRTLRRDADRVALRSAHLAHLCADAAAIGIAVDAERLENALEPAGLPHDAALKLCVWRGGAGRGYAPAPDAIPHVALFAHDLPDYPVDCWRKGVDVVRLSATLSRNPRLAGVKHCNRLDQVLAAQELAPTGAAEGLCRDAQGHFVCGTRSNIFVRAENILHTPPITDCGVRGLMRGVILACAERRGIVVQETPLDEALLACADAMLLSNSLIGIWPVARIDGTALPGSAGLAHGLLADLGPPFAKETSPVCAP